MYICCIFTVCLLVFDRYIVEEGAVSIGASLMRSEASRSLVDYDNHMDNITMDWRNTEINSLIEKCT